MLPRIIKNTYNNLYRILLLIKHSKWYINDREQIRTRK